MTTQLIEPFEHKNVVVTFGGTSVSVTEVTIKSAQPSITEPQAEIEIVAPPAEKKEWYQENLPTWFILQQRRYDRINAFRDYLKQIARGKRHHGKRNKPFRKLARKRIRR